MAFLIVTLIGIAVLGYLVWKNRDQVVALFKPNSGTSLPNPGVEAKAPTVATPVVPGTNMPMNGILAGYLAGGSGNGVPSAASLTYDAKVVYRKDTFLDGPGTFWFPAGITPYTLKANGGDVVNVVIGPAEEGHGAGSVIVEDKVQAIVNGYATLYFQVLKDNPVLTVNCDKPGLLQRS